VRPLAPEGRVFDVDQPRVHFRERLVVNPQVVGRVWPVVDDDHVHLGDELVDDLSAFWALEVDREATLAPVQGHERARLERHELRLQTPRLAPGRLDLDHLRAHVGKQHACEGCGDYLREFEDLDAFERSSHQKVLHLFSVKVRV